MLRLGRDRQRFAAAFAACDVILSPTTAGPATAVPFGATAAGLPIGAQLAPPQALPERKALDLGKAA